jgi:hypothetical protein
MERQAERKVVVSVWANHIEVTERESELEFCGTGLYFGSASKWNAAGLFKDLLERFDAFRSATRAESKRAPHLCFANATSFEEQLAFVREFGPILAHKAQGDAENDRIVAYQNIAILQAEQSLFSLVYELVRTSTILHEWSLKAFPARDKYVAAYSSGITLEDCDPSSEKYSVGLKRGAKLLDSAVERECRPTIDQRAAFKHLRSLLAQFLEAVAAYPKMAFDIKPAFAWQELCTFVPLGSKLDHGDMLTVVSEANDLLCRVFNRFPVGLCYGNGMAITVPEIGPTGIRPILYYMLREDYLFSRPFRVCTLQGCSNYFVPVRRDTRYCSDECQNRAKQRRYYAKEVKAPSVVN